MIGVESDKAFNLTIGVGNSLVVKLEDMIR